MFNAEPQEKLTAEEISEFEAYAAERLHATLRKASYAGILLLANVLCIVPFLQDILYIITGMASAGILLSPQKCCSYGLSIKQVWCGRRGNRHEKPGVSFATLTS